MSGGALVTSRSGPILNPGSEMPMNSACKRSLSVPSVLHCNTFTAQWRVPHDGRCGRTVLPGRPFPAAPNR